MRREINVLIDQKLSELKLEDKLTKLVLNKQEYYDIEFKYHVGEPSSVNYSEIKNNFQLLFLSNDEDFKDILRDNNSLKVHIFFISKKLNMETINKFQRNKNLRGFFLIHDIELPNYDPFNEAVYDAIRKIIKYDFLKKKENNYLNGKDQYYDIKDSIINLTNDDAFYKDYGTFFFDKKMMKVVMGLSYYLDYNVKNLLIKLNENKAIKDIKDRVNKSQFSLKDIANLCEKNNLSSLNIKIPSILILGETGVGKTMLAKWIYEEVLKPDVKNIGSFGILNASILSSELVDSELFGYVKGAFTGAENDKIGIALKNIGGVLFIDEIGDLNNNVQTKILKFIEEKIIQPTGWDGSNIYSPLLIVAATNKDIEKEVNENRFRKDLYNRFEFVIKLPSLNERKNSIKPIMIYHLMKKLRNDNTIKYITKNALKKFEELDYSDGNFRFLNRLLDRIIYKTKKYDLRIILEEIVDEMYNKMRKK